MSINPNPKFSISNFSVDQEVAIIVTYNPLDITIEKVLEVTPKGSVITSGGYVFISPYGKCYNGHHQSPTVAILTQEHLDFVEAKKLRSRLSNLYDHHLSKLSLSNLRTIVELWHTNLSSK